LAQFHGGDGRTVALCDTATPARGRYSGGILQRFCDENPGWMDLRNRGTAGVAMISEMAGGWLSSQRSRLWLSKSERGMGLLQSRAYENID
jgi:hypothetical protein